MRIQDLTWEGCTQPVATLPWGIEEETPAPRDTHSWYLDRLLHHLNPEYAYVPRFEICRRCGKEFRINSARYRPDRTLEWRKVCKPCATSTSATN